MGRGKLSPPYLHLFIWAHVDLKVGILNWKIAKYADNLRVTPSRFERDVDTNGMYIQSGGMQPMQDKLN